MPRVRCDTCGVHQVEVPRAREGSGFTLLFEAMALRLVTDMPLCNAAEIMGEHDTRIWRVVHHHVDNAHAESDWIAGDIQIATNLPQASSSTVLNTTRFSEDPFFVCFKP